MRCGRHLRGTAASRWTRRETRSSSRSRAPPTRSRPPPMGRQRSAAGRSACAWGSTRASRSSPRRATSGSTSTARRASLPPGTAGRSSCRRRRATSSAAHLRDLGEHRLKDLSAPERLFQLGDAEFPRLKTLYQTNLPVPATPFLGRGRELDEVVRLLGREDVRLLTLTGPGGTGKTRLALQAAAEVAEDAPDGVWWISLAALRDPALALDAVAKALDVRERPGFTVEETLVDALTAKRALLLIDNAEHLLPHVAREIAHLRELGGPKLLVTSRERLQLQGEHAWSVPSLDENDGTALFTRVHVPCGPSSRRRGPSRSSAHASTTSRSRSSSRPRASRSSRPSSCSNGSGTASSSGAGATSTHDSRPWTRRSAGRRPPRAGRAAAVRAACSVRRAARTRRPRP